MYTIFLFVLVGYCPAQARPGRPNSLTHSRVRLQFTPITRLRLLDSPVRLSLSPESPPPTLNSCSSAILGFSTSLSDQDINIQGRIYFSYSPSSIWGNEFNVHQTLVAAGSSLSYFCNSAVQLFGTTNWNCGTLEHKGIK
ncbi:hypothetical protein RchiOBHm_Chr2g0144661 [Rosa chinensis]|uniref:Uncharacterized protein n=1 Tax=Rosa chinensis TaxID=74649 RepID=A0A2P6RYF0_ROSCH|nr:hypothetical protein RchiOBHm_Chr2g0144661 [Rosa chinensis]